MIDLIVDFNDPKSKEKLWECLRTLSGEQIIKIKRRVKGRSIQENRYYFGVLLSYIADETGLDPIFLHEYYKYKFIPMVKFDDVSRLSTADMTHEQLWDYMKLIADDVKKVFGFSVPDPDGVIL